MMALYPFVAIMVHLPYVNCTWIISLGCKCCLMRVCFITYSWVTAFDSSLASGMLPECSLHGPDGCRATYELPVLWYYMCHQHRWTDYYRSFITTGKGMVKSFDIYLYKNMEQYFLCDNYFFNTNLRIFLW